MTADKISSSATHLVLLGPSYQPVKLLAPLDLDVLDLAPGHIRRPTVPRRDEHLADLGGLGELVGEGVFPTSGSKQEDAERRGRGGKGRDGRGHDGGGMFVLFCVGCQRLRSITLYG